MKSLFDMVREGGAFLIYPRLERERNPLQRVGPTKKHCAACFCRAMASRTSFSTTEICQIVDVLKRLVRQGPP